MKNAFLYLINVVKNLWLTFVRSKYDCKRRRNHTFSEELCFNCVHRGRCKRRYLKRNRKVIKRRYENENRTQKD